jgi:hypothetical protein
MAEKRPICRYSGKYKELQSGDTLPVTANQVLPDQAGQDGKVLGTDGANVGWVEGGGGGGVTWQTVTTGPVFMEHGQGYRIDSATMLDLYLPNVANDILVGVKGLGTGGFAVHSQGGDVIAFGHHVIPLSGWIESISQHATVFFTPLNSNTWSADTITGRFYHVTDIS